jgi:hypothetical protein
MCAKMVAVLQPSFRSADIMIIDPPASEEVVNKSPRGRDGTRGIEGIRIRGG